MSAKPRSVLKKRPGNHDDRRVSFANPLSSDKEKTRVPLPIATACPAPKKAKPADEVVDIIMLGNQQSDLTENVQDVERKLEKQLSTMYGMTNELMAFAEPVAAFSSESSMVHSKIAEHQKVLKEVTAKRDGLIKQCKQFETLNSSQPQSSSQIVELQKVVSLINCFKMEDLEQLNEVSGYYDRLLNIYDQIMAQI